MTVFLFALFLSSAQQARHDAAELAMYQKLQAYQRAIDDIWQPNPEVLSAQRTARQCYTDFHLYKVDSCDKELATVFHALRRNLASEQGN